MKKIKTYILTVSKVYPVTHKRKGESTNFPENILNGTKIHTIRAKYDTWKKRIDEVNEGLAVLKVVNWSGKPYNSKQEPITIFDKDSGIDVQELKFINSDFRGSFLSEKKIVLLHSDLSKNDGLSLEDFKEWFKNYDLSEPMAIIHFTNFRY